MIDCLSELFGSANRLNQSLVASRLGTVSSRNHPNEVSDKGQKTSVMWVVLLVIKLHFTQDTKEQCSLSGTMTLCMTSDYNHDIITLLNHSSFIISV